MNTIHQPILLPKMPTIRQRLPFSGVSPVSMIKLDRGLVQRSLLYCFEKGYFSLIRYLLQSGSGDVQERDNEGRTALMYCCFIDNDCWAQSIAIILLEYNARIDDQDHRGLNALHYAIITQRLILIRRYLSSLDFSLDQIIDIHGNTFLHYACSTGNPDVVRLILNRMKHYSIDLNIKNYSGSTAYDIACQLNHTRCQNLLRNDLILREHQNLPSNKAHITVKPVNKRRLSSPIRTRSVASTAHYTGSIASVPLLISNSKNFHQNCSSTESFNTENIVCSSPMFIDPIESRHIKLKRNENLDLSLTNQAKNRADFAPSPFISQSTIFNASSSTWRDDFSKMFDQLQTYKTPSYRKTVYPPLDNELSCELFEKLYGMGGGRGHDCSNHQPLLSRPRNFSQKITHRRRSSITSIKSFHRMKK